METNLRAAVFAFLPLAEVLTSVNLVCSGWSRTRKNVPSTLVGQDHVPNSRQVTQARWNFGTVVSLHVESKETNENWLALTACYNVEHFHLRVASDINWSELLPMLANLRFLQSLHIERSKHHKTYNYCPLEAPVSSRESLEALMRKLTQLELERCTVYWTELVCPRLMSVSLSSCKIPGRLFANLPNLSTATINQVSHAVFDISSAFELDVLNTSPKLRELDVSGDLWVRAGVWVTTSGQWLPRNYIPSAETPSQLTSFLNLRKLRCRDIYDIELLNQLPSLESLVSGGFLPLDTIGAFHTLPSLKELDLTERVRQGRRDLDNGRLDRAWLLTRLATFPALEIFKVDQTGFVAKDVEKWFRACPTLQRVVLMHVGYSSQTILKKLDFK
jgi:hypothetical protein